MVAVNDNNFCPVCGFGLDFKPWNNDSPSDEICPSCSFQFGLDDYDDELGYKIKDQKYKEWRKQWIKEGMIFKHHQPEFNEPPPNWNPLKQLKNIPKEFLGPDEHY